MISKSFRRQTWFWTAALLASALLASGCADETMSSSASVTTVTRTDDGSDSSGNRGASDLAQGVFDIFDLKKLDLESDAAVGVQDLGRLANDFSGNAGLVEPAPGSLEKLFKPAELKLLRDKQFGEADGEQVRSSMLFRELAKAAVGEADTSRKQMFNMFNFLISMVDLVPSGEALPLTAYEVCLAGRGTAEDRAWIFAGMLRQLKIDSVLLLPAEADKREPMLLAALLKEGAKDQIYLFDLRGGVTPLVGGNPKGEPAPLEQALADPLALAVVAGSDGQPLWTAQSLGKARVALIGSLPLWSSRMASVQPQFIGDRALILSDPLPDTDRTEGTGNAPGYVARVVSGSGGRWKAETLSVWLHSEEVLARRAALDSKGKDAVEAVLSPLQSPIKTQRNEKGLEFDDPNTGFVQMGTPSRLAWRGRLSQLTGDTGKAITEYTQVQRDSKFPEHSKIDPRIRKAHDQARADMRYLTALCQFQQGKTKQAARTLEKYLSAFPEGIWVRPALRHLALCQADQGAHDKALETLKKIPADDPHAPWVKLHVALWSAVK